MYMTAILFPFHLKKKANEDDIDLLMKMIFQLRTQSIDMKLDEEARG